MLRPPPRSTRTDHLCPYPTRFRSLHFIHARGDGSLLPLMLIHGWPGSFLEFEQLIGPLVASGHDVIVPSLPGYAFSGRPEAPIGPRRTAELFHQLLVDLFGPGQYRSEERRVG